MDLHKNGTNAYFGFFFTSILVYLFYTIYQFRKDAEKFSDDIWRIRKVFYVLFLTLTGIGVVAGYVDFRDWKILLQLTAFVVFIDLAVFQTPSITKIWNAEFQHRAKIEKTIEVNVDFINSTAIKLQAFSDVIKQTADYFEPKTDIPQNWNGYQRELKQFLSLYTSQFRFRLEMFHFRIGSDETETKQHIGRALSQLETLFLYELDDAPDKDNQPGFRSQVIDKLTSGIGTSLETDKLIVIPIFQNRSLLIGIRTSEGSRVDEVDITNIVNLSRIFHWYMT